MDKILEKLATLGVQAEDLNDIKKSFDEAVEAKVKINSDKEARVLAEKSADWCKKQIAEAKQKITAETEEMAKLYCQKIKEQYEKEANEKVQAYAKSLDEASEAFVFNQLEEKFREKYGEELKAIENKVITGIDKYLEFNIKEKIGPKLIQKTAMSEMYAPIIDGVKSLFEEQYIPLDLTGAKKIREMKAENAELQKSLKKQLSENLRLAEVAEVNSKKALIAEKTEGMTPRQKAKVNRLFENKTFSETKKDIDNCIEMLDEEADQIRALREDRQRLFERAKRAKRQSAFVEDRTENINEGYKRPRPLTRNEENLLRSARYCDDE